MAIDPLENVYAPPAAINDASPRSLRRGEPRTYEDEKRSVALMFLLTVVTLGIYPSVWFFRRRHFLSSRESPKALGALAYAPLVPWAVMIAMGAVSSFFEIAPALDRLVQVAGYCINVAAGFRARAVLRSDFARTGRLLGVSGVGTFFFGVFYLQHKINEAAHTPARARRAGPG